MKNIIISFLLVISAFTSAAGVLDPPPISKATVTNIATAVALSTSPRAYLATSYPISLMQNGSYTTTWYGFSFGNIVSNSFVATNISLFVKIASSNAIGVVTLYDSDVIPTSSIGTPIWTNSSVSFNYSPSTFESISIPMPSIQITSGHYYELLIRFQNTNILTQGYFYNHNSGIPLWSLSSLSGATDLSPTNNFSACAFNFSGYQNVSGNASNTAYTDEASGIPGATTVKKALDTLGSSIDLSKTIIIVDGDSKATGLDSYIKADPWMSKFAWYSNVAVGGTGLSDVTNSWETKTRLFSSNLIGGTNGIYLLWTGHNEYTQPIPEWITKLTNHIARVASSNFSVVLLTTAPRASYNQDSTNSYEWVSAVNNWERDNAPVWRLIDAGAIFEDVYNMTPYSDTTHLEPFGNSNIINMIVKCLTTEQRFVRPSLRPVSLFGTNLVFTAPQTNGLLRLVGNVNGNTWNIRPTISAKNGVSMVNCASAPILSYIGETNTVIEWWSNSVPPTKYATYYDFNSNVVNKVIVTFP